MVCLLCLLCKVWGSCAPASGCNAAQARQHPYKLRSAKLTCPNLTPQTITRRDMRRGEQRAVALALEPDHLHVDIRWQGQLPGQPSLLAG